MFISSGIHNKTIDIDAANQSCSHKAKLGSINFISLWNTIVYFQEIEMTLERITHPVLEKLLAVLIDLSPRQSSRMAGTQKNTIS